MPHMTTYGPMVPKWTGSGPECIHPKSFRSPGYIHEMNEQECEGSTSTERLHPAILPYNRK